MRIERLYINNFRILENILLEPEKVNFIIGNNGQGKTSILEAISLISGRSFRKTPDKELVRIGEKSYLIQINLNKSCDSNIIQISYNINGKKNLTLNDKRIKIIDMIKLFPLITCSLYDISLAYEQKLRKVFFDKMISYIDNVYYNNLIKLNKAFKNRNRLIKEKRDTLFWDITIAEILPLLMDKRVKVVDSFNKFLKTYHKEFPGGIKSIEFVYNPNIRNIDKDSILRLFEESKIKDRERGFSTIIGLDQYSILVNGKKIRYFASTGQIKLIVFILFFLQTVFVYRNSGVRPILLLDDIFSDIDSYNREKLLTLILENDFQTFVTMTLEDFSHIKIKSNIIKVFKGRIIEY